MSVVYSRQDPSIRRHTIVQAEGGQVKSRRFASYSAEVEFSLVYAFYAVALN